MSELKFFSTTDLNAIAEKAFQAMGNAEATGSRGGCGRVYIEFSGGIRDNSKVKSTLQNTGFKVTRRPNFNGVRIYVGYDNASGKEFSMADKAASIFQEHGIRCYVDADGD